jgi:hypothetical protein
VKSSGVNISEQAFGMEMDGSDCGDFLVISMNIIAETENAWRSSAQSTYVLCVTAKFNEIL